MRILQSHTHSQLNQHTGRPASASRTRQFEVVQTVCTTSIHALLSLTYFTTPYQVEWWHIFKVQRVASIANTSCCNTCKCC